MKIIIETIPHSKQRYPTVGDYQYLSDGTVYITVSEMGDERYESMVAIHELIEERLTRWKGIKEEDITNFDLAFEKARQLGLRREDEEPGFHNDAPYLMEHTLATAVEMMMCAHAGIKWNEYSATVNEL